MLEPDGDRRRRRWKAVLLFALAMAVAAFGVPAFATSSRAGTAAVVHPAAHRVADVSLPCDIYAAGGTPCVTAHTTTRALFASYNGPLYQIQRASDHSYRDIGLLGGRRVRRRARPQVSFCAGTSCTITKIYDQTANHNDMPISWGGYWKGPGPNGADVGADAMALPLTVGGPPGVRRQGHPGRRLPASTTPRTCPPGSQPEGIYMVTSSNYVEPVVLLRLRQRRELPHRHRQRHHERHRLGHRLLVRRLHRHRPVGRGRPGERHVPHQHRLQQGPEQPRRALPVRQRRGRRTTAPATSPSNTATPPAAD